MPKLPSRRRILSRLAATMLATIIPINGVAARAPRRISRLRAMLRSCGCEETADMLGHACLMHAEPADFTNAAARVERRFDHATVRGADFARWYRDETTSDFDAGRVVRVSGWVISQTEFWVFSRLATNA